MMNINNDFLTPSDISRIKFSITFRGYNIQQVDEFIEQIQMNYTKIWKENQELKNQVDFLKKELEAYKIMENIINDSVIASKKLAEDIKYQAQQEANYILIKANKEAEEIRSNYQKLIMNLIQEINKIKEIRQELLNETRAYLNILLSKLDYIENSFSNREEFLLNLNLNKSLKALTDFDNHKKEVNYE